MKYNSSFQPEAIELMSCDEKPLNVRCDNGYVNRNPSSTNTQIFRRNDEEIFPMPTYIGAIKKKMSRT